MTKHRRLSMLIIPILAISALIAQPSAAFAQRRGPVHHSVVVVGGFGFGPRFYDPFYDPFFYSAWYPYPAYGVYAPYGYGPRGYALSSSLRIQVTPRQAEVYVDGYRAGVVDDFDGIFQRLALEPGGHDIVIYLEGYRTWTSHMYFTPGSSQNVKFALTPLASGEVAEARPVPAQPAVPDAPAGMRVRPPVQIPGSAEPRAPQQPPPPPPPGTSSDRPAPRPLDRTAAGSVGIRVQPSGAEIFIDGERWQALGNGDQLVVQLAEGKHHVEVRKSGYETFSTDVDVARGVMLPLNISLKR